MRKGKSIQQLRIEKMLETKKLIDHRYQAMRRTDRYIRPRRPDPRPTRPADDLFRI